MNIDGTNCFPVSNSGYWEQYPTWTPDGLKILFYLNGFKSLYMISANENSTDKVEMVKFLDDDNPGWGIDPLGGFSMSPDGQLVCASVCYIEPNGILTIDPNIGKSSIKSLLPASIYGGLESPVFSPDGTKIAFVILERDSLANQQAVCIKSMNSDGTDLTQIVRVKTFEADMAGPYYNGVVPLCWSPDGNKLLFTALTEQNGGYHLMCVNADGSNLIQVTDDMNAYDYYVSWGR